MGYSDHRLSWVDIRLESALGLFRVIQRSLVRRLQCDDPHSAEKYKRIIEEMIDNVNIVDMILLLEQTVTTLMLDTDMAKYEELDNIITKCMLKAEKRCRKLCRGVYLDLLK